MVSTVDHFPRNGKLPVYTKIYTPTYATHPATSSLIDQYNRNKIVINRVSVQRPLRRVPVQL